MTNEQVAAYYAALPKDVPATILVIDGTQNIAANLEIKGISAGMVFVNLTMTNIERELRMAGFAPVLHIPTSNKVNEEFNFNTLENLKMKKDQLSWDGTWSDLTTANKLVESLDFSVYEGNEPAIIKNKPSPLLSNKVNIPISNPNIDLSNKLTPPQTP